jgi:hypothetical protein
MTMTAAIAAALTVLTEALDDPTTDIAHSLQLLTFDAAAAIESYCGLSVVVPQSDPPLTATMLADGTVADDIRTSLQFRLPGRNDPRRTPAVVIIVYAGSPGAFVDLAADLAWLTARPPSDFVLDEHVALAVRSTPEGQLHAAAAINQAIGVLIGRGYTPQQADWQLDTQAANNRTDRFAAARHILANIHPSDDDGHCDMH